jgi:hypothetical protein
LLKNFDDSSAEKTSIRNFKIVVNLTGERSKDHRDLRGDYEPRGGGVDEEEPLYVPVPGQQQQQRPVPGQQQQQLEQRRSPAQQVGRGNIQHNVSS